MIFVSDDWKLDIDLDATMVRSAQEAAEHCDCAYCRNFYAAVDAHYPKLRPFLAEFGLDINAPDAQFPYDHDGTMYYDSIYLVYGSILHSGSAPVHVDGVEILPIDGADTYMNPPSLEPYFALEVGTVILPWVLDEPLHTARSPANEPSFLKKMWERLLRKATKNAGIS